MEQNIKEILSDLDFETAQALIEQEKITKKEKQPDTEDKTQRDKESHHDYHRKKDDRQRDRERERDSHKDRERDYDRHRDRDKNKNYCKERQVERHRERDSNRDHRDHREHRDYIDRDDRNRHDYLDRERKQRSDYRKDRGNYSSSQRDRETRYRTRSRSRENKRRHSRSRSGDKKEKIAVEKTIEEARRQALEAQRDDCTILMYRLPLEVKEKDIFFFFAKANIGRVIDIKLIRDPRTGKPKGVCYVEFESQESVPLACSLSGQLICGQPAVIQSSQAEKNRLAAAAKYKKEQLKEHQQRLMKMPDVLGQVIEPPMKIYVGGLTENLGDITESDLQNIFPFGDIDFIDLPRDPISGKCMGYAYIQFRTKSQGLAAIAAMNGFNYKGKILKVGEVPEGTRNGNELFNATKEMDEIALHNIQSKMTLMQKLNKDTNAMIGAFPPISTVSQSHCVLLTNLFDPNQVDLEKDPDFYNDTYIDVKEQCMKYGDVDKIYVDENSMGNVWVKFANKDNQAAQKAYESLNGRWFAGRPISVSFVTEDTFNENTPA